MVITILFLITSLYVCICLGAPSRDTKSLRVMTAQGGWVQVAVAAIGAVAGVMQQKKAAKSKSGMSKDEIRESGAEDRRSMAFEAALKDYYGQVDKERSSKALANFSRWSTVSPGEGGFYTPSADAQPHPQQFNSLGASAGGNNYDPANYAARTGF